MNDAPQNEWETYGYLFIDNNKITMEKPWKDLTNSAKGVVINIFVQSLNSSRF